MINLLPPQIKEQTMYAKRNAKLVGRIKLAVFLIVLLGGALGGGYIILNRRIAQAGQDLQAKQQEVSSFKDLEQQVSTVNARVATLKKLQAGQTHFSVLLTNIANAMPTNAVISSINLSSDEKRPVVISAFANDYNSAVGLRDALAKMPGVTGVDIQVVSSSNGKVAVQLVAQLTPAAMKGVNQ